MRHVGQLVITGTVSRHKLLSAYGIDLALKADSIYDYSKTLDPTLPNSDYYIASLIEQSAMQLNCACETLAELQKQMTALSEQLSEYNAVMEMFGVGKVLAPQLIAVIGDTLRFHSRKAITAFAGLDAPPYQSGNIDVKFRKHFQTRLSTFT